jgi:hypothetical protein
VLASAPVLANAPALLAARALAPDAHEGPRDLDDAEWPRVVKKSVNR